METKRQMEITRDRASKVTIYKETEARLSIKMNYPRFWLLVVKVPL
ncbi:MAG: hypothetical protein U0571_11655 [Candidatus Brocadia sapporoensis]